MVLTWIAAHPFMLAASYLVVGLLVAVVLASLAKIDNRESLAVACLLWPVVLVAGFAAFGGPLCTLAGRLAALIVRRLGRRAQQEGKR